MSDKLTDAEKRQAEIVAEQEAAQSAPPFPSQDHIDLARLGVEPDADEPKLVEKVAEPEKPTATYKTRAAKAE